MIFLWRAFSWCDRIFSIWLWLTCFFALDFENPGQKCDKKSRAKFALGKIYKEFLRDILLWIFEKLKKYSLFIHHAWNMFKIDLFLSTLSTWYHNNRNQITTIEVLKKFRIPSLLLLQSSWLLRKIKSSIPHPNY